MLNLLVFFPELQDAVLEVLPGLSDHHVRVFILADECKNAGMESFKDKMRQASREPISKDLRSQLNLASTAVYIYTSGTTGEMLKVRSGAYGKWKMAAGMTSTVDSLRQVYPKRRRSVTANCG